MGCLSAESIRAGLQTATFGQKVHYVRQTSSTNDEARDLASAGAPEGTLVITDYQSAGRGRLGRRWVAPPGSSLLMSILLRPQISPHLTQQLTMACALAIADAVGSETGLAVDLKWPNDIMVRGAKLGGILTEAELQGGEICWAVVGIGLNVNIDPGQFPPGLIVPATSLSHLLEHSVERLPLLWSILLGLERRYQAVVAGRGVHNEWSRRLDTLGQEVRVITGDVTLQGIAEAVDRRGALLVRLTDGRLERVLAGDVVLRTAPCASQR